MGPDELRELDRALLAARRLREAVEPYGIAGSLDAAERAIEGQIVSRIGPGRPFGPTPSDPDQQQAGAGPARDLRPEGREKGER
ncbi:MAG: hypothetical protein IVW52_04935 [Acidimicrobiales bacterium]|nr:hypothetical protein [Acidimicrobiales bacterium]